MAGFEPGILLAALILDALLGEPAWLYRRVAHPVVWIGQVIAAVDRWVDPARCRPFIARLAGLVLTAALVLGAVGIGGLLTALTETLPGGGLLEVALVAVFLAGRSLHDHVAKVARALRTGGVTDGRRAVGMIVGRDVSRLDESGIVRAAIETLAENASDGLFAPALFYLVFGLPGLLAYKAVNTADSMIGHKTARYRDFGWAAARLDDVLNWVPARMTAALIALGAVGPNWDRTASKRAWRSATRDAQRHKSPNAGWPEAAMAGALDLRLGGPRNYGPVQVEGAWLGTGRRTAALADLDASLQIYRRAATVFGIVLLVLAILT